MSIDQPFQLMVITLQLAITPTSKSKQGRRSARPVAARSSCLLCAVQACARQARALPHTYPLASFHVTWSEQPFLQSMNIFIYVTLFHKRRSRSFPDHQLCEGQKESVSSQAVQAPSCTGPSQKQESSASPSVGAVGPAPPTPNTRPLFGRSRPRPCNKRTLDVVLTGARLGLVGRSFAHVARDSVAAWQERPVRVALVGRIPGERE